MKQPTLFTIGRWGLLSLILALSLITSSALAEDNPETIAGVRTLNAEQLIELAAREPGLLIVDSRIPGDRKLGFIEGSVSLPNTDTRCETLDNILPEKQAPILFYCNGIKCGRSAKAIAVAKTCGYSNIYWFRGGFEEWLAKGYPYLQQQ